MPSFVVPAGSGILSAKEIVMKMKLYEHPEAEEIIIKYEDNILSDPNPGENEGIEIEP